jgi:hypothetical protein
MKKASGLGLLCLGLALGYLAFAPSSPFRDPQANTAQVRTPDSPAKSVDPARGTATGGTASRTESKKSLSVGSATGAPAPTPLPATDAPVASYFAQLKARAQQGDANAACRIAHDLTRCGETLPIERRQLAALLRLVDPAMPGYSKAIADRISSQVLGSYRSHLAANEERCANFSIDPAEPAVWQYVLQSAQGGNVSAMNRFVYGVGLTPGSPAANPEAWLAYKQFAPQLLDAAVSSGDSFAFYLAARAYESPESTFGLKIYEPDPLKAIKYYAAAAGRSAPNTASLFSRSIDDLSKKFKLPAQDVEQAKLFGAALAATTPRLAPTRPLDIHNSVADGAMAPERCEQ